MSDITPRPSGPVMGRTNWQMAHGERLAIEGLLSQIKPNLAIEIGTAQGGSLDRIARHAKEVHSFDLAPEVDAAEYPNVTFHVGDSHELLARQLRRFEREGRNVDFALVDGDHSAAGVRQDAAELLRSPALRRSWVVMHDTQNEAVRAGLMSLRLHDQPGIIFSDLAFVQLFQDPSSAVAETWGGLGLVVVDRDGSTGVTPEQRVRDYSLSGRVRRAAWAVMSPLRSVLRRGRDALRLVRRRR